MVTLRIKGLLNYLIYYHAFSLQICNHVGSDTKFNPIHDGVFRGCLRIVEGEAKNFIHNSFDLYWVFKGFFNQHEYNFDDVSKIGSSRPP